MTVLVYVVVFPTTGCAVLVALKPSGPLHTVFTVTGTSTNGLNSTVQVKKMEDPTGRTGLGTSLVIVADNSGT